MGTGLDTTMYSFASDFHDEGLDDALARIQTQGGVGGVAMAVVYHHGRDLFPHNPRRKVIFHEGGAAFFRPEQQRYDSCGIQPPTAALAQHWEALAELREATSQRGMTLDAWTVFLHNTRAGTAHPDCAVQNAFGDPQQTYLCPAHPRTRDYCVALAGDIARYGCDSLIAEALHYLPLEHGFHHERYMIDIGPVDRLLLGLCFCPHCLAHAGRAGVDVVRLHRAVRDRLDTALADSDAYDGRPGTMEELRTLWSGELAAYLGARSETVTGLAGLVQEALEGSGTKLAFMDPSPTVTAPTAAGSKRDCVQDVPWRFGIDPAGLARACDQIAILAYAEDPAAVASDVDSYAAAVGQACDLRVGLSPMPPGCPDAANLREKLRGIMQSSVRDVDFYHYGFMRLETLDVIRSALGGR